MATINPYLNFAGNTEEAFNFYKSVFGGEFLSVVRFKDTEHGANLPKEDQEKLMHISLPVSGNILMGTDALESAGHYLKVGDNITLSVDTASLEEANTIFNSLSAGGNIEVPVQKMFWGAWFGMFTDKFGIKWMVNFDENKPKI